VRHPWRLVHKRGGNPRSFYAVHHPNAPLRGPGSIWPPNYPVRHGWEQEALRTEREFHCSAGKPVHFPAHRESAAGVGELGNKAIQRRLEAEWPVVLAKSGVRRPIGLPAGKRQAKDGKGARLYLGTDPKFGPSIEPGLNHQNREKQGCTLSRADLKAIRRLRPSSQCCAQQWCCRDS
jgi:hypothetical protein